MKCSSITSNEEACWINERGIFERIHVIMKVINIVLACCCKICYQSSFFIMDNDCTCSCWCFCRIMEISNNTFFFKYILQCLSLLILCYWSKVNNFIATFLIFKKVVHWSSWIKSRSTRNCKSSFHSPKFIINWKLLITTKRSLSLNKFVFL